MKYVIAPDSFKENMSALDAARQIAAGIRAVQPDAECEIVPMADGGDGTSDVLKYHFGCREVRCRVSDPFGNPIDTSFLYLEGLGIAWIEVAMACGLMLIPAEKRDPFIATSYGVGEMIREALELDCKEIILSLGGTGTSDGGIGMLKALGAEFYEADGSLAQPGVLRLGDVHRVNLAPAAEKLHGKSIRVLCDVTNPLLGAQGATYVFAPQKGAHNGSLERLEAEMAHYAACVEAALGEKKAHLPGAGAAGGLGFALYAVSDAEFVGGAEYIINLLHLEEKIRGCDALFTGEGRFDTQSLAGKVPVALAGIAARHGVPVVVLAGSIGADMQPAYDKGISAAFCIQREPGNLQAAIAQGPDNLFLTAQNVAQLLCIASNKNGR